MGGKRGHRYYVQQKRFFEKKEKFKKINLRQYVNEIELCHIYRTLAFP